MVGLGLVLVFLIVVVVVVVVVVAVAVVVVVGVVMIVPKSTNVSLLLTMRSMDVIPTNDICKPMPGDDMMMMMTTTTTMMIMMRMVMVIVIMMIVTITIVMMMMMMMMMLMMILMTMVPIIVPTLTDFGMIFIITLDSPVTENTHSSSPAMNADVNAWVIDSVPFNTKLYVIYVDSPTPGANPNGRLPMIMMM